MITLRLPFSSTLAGTLLLSASALTGCGDEAPACPAVEAWAAPEWDANTAEAITLREQLNTVVSGMRDVEEGATLDTAALAQGFDEGTPSLRTIGNPGFASVAENAVTEFVALAQVGPLDLVDDTGAWAPGEHGGIFGSGNRGLNEGGLEVRQIVDKGLFAGGAFYRYAAHETASGADAATIEAISAAFGADATLDPEMRTDSANYAGSMGYFDDVTIALTVARGHAEVADEACTPERDTALVTAFRTWELAMFARFVFYVNEAHATIAAELTDDTVATAAHQISEGIGLALGFYGMDAPSSGPLAGGVRVTTDADIEAMMSAIGVNIGDLGASTTGTLLVDPAALQAGATAVEAAVAEAFDLTADEVAAFRVETEGE